MTQKINNRNSYSRDIEKRTEEYFAKLPSISRGVKPVDKCLAPKIDENNYQDEHSEEELGEDRR